VASTELYGAFRTECEALKPGPISSSPRVAGSIHLVQPSQQSAAGDSGENHGSGLISSSPTVGGSIALPIVPRALPL
jgi:hypothetical protein